MKNPHGEHLPGQGYGKLVEGQAFDEVARTRAKTWGSQSIML